MRWTTTAVCFALTIGFWCSGAHSGGPLIEFELERIARGLQQPLAARHAGDSSGRLFIVEQDGTIRIVDRTGRLLAAPFLDLSVETGLGLTNSSGEQGLLGLDFHPQFSANRQFYVNYTNLAGDTVVERYLADAVEPNLAEPASGQVVITIAQDFANHNGGDIHFGPDGFLYVGMGDGGSGGDPNDRAQDPGSLLGKMLRLDVDNPGANAANACGLALNYGIPASNPFLGDDGVCDEIWAIGLRNPFRFSFDAQTGDMFIGDVGQRVWEEINFQPAAFSGGENYGWDCREGAHDYPTSPDSPGSPAISCPPPIVADPILEFQHAAGRCSVVGGYRYRGPLQDAVGIYFYGDFCSGEIFAATPSMGIWTGSALPLPYRDEAGNNVSLRISAFGEDEDKNLYVIDLNGDVYRFGQLILISGFED